MANNNEKSKKTENTNPPENTQAKDEGIQITPPDSNDNSPVEMCILCEKNPAYKTATVDSDLCEECRKGFLRTPLHIGGIIAVFFIIVLAFSGLMLARPQSAEFTAIRDGYKNIQAGNYDVALKGIVDTANQGTMGWKSAGAFAELCGKINLPTDLTFLVESFFYDKTADSTLQWQDIAGKGNLNASWNKELKEKYDYLVLIEKIADEKSTYFTDYYTLFQSGEIEPKDIPYDEIISKYKTDFAAATTNEEKGIICYYMLATSNICEKDVRTQFNYCKSIQQYIPDCYWLYLDNLITLSIQAGEYSEAQKNIDTLTTLSSTDKNYAKRYTAMMYRYQGKYDESLAILKDLIANIETTGIYEAYYEAMLCEMFKGNTKEAREYAIDCVELEYYMTYDSINLYAILCKQANDDEGYQFASDIFEQYGMKLSPTVDKYLNGEITTEELFKDGEVVFE